MALKVTLTSATGKHYLLTGIERTSPVLSPIEALTNLSGKSSRSDVAVPARSGVIPGRRRFEPIQTELEFYLHADDGAEMEALYKEFRQGWSDSVASLLRVEADHPLGAFTLPLLRDQPLPGVPVDMSTRTSATVMVAVFDALGLFRSEPLSGTGTVTVTNPGDEVVYPWVTYQGAGGPVTTPSGAEFTLPPSVDEVTLQLDPRTLRLDGAFAEGIEPEATGTWVLPAGVRLGWHILVADPWA